MELLLKFVIKFYESKHGLKECLESFFKDIVEDSTLSISDTKTLSFDDIYLSNVAEIEINLNYSSSEYPGNLIRRIAQDWCDKKINYLSNLWLSFVNASNLENKGTLCHSDVVVTEVSFGTFPDMQHFIQHYTYESKSDETEIISAFFHNQKECNVFFCFIPAKSCEQEKCSYYKFQFTYASINRVVVNYVPDCEIVEIYFHLQHVPALFVGKIKQKYYKTVNCSVSNSVQEYQNNFYWNRTLDFGCKCKKSLSSFEIGRCPIFKMMFPSKFKTHEITERLIQKCPKDTAFYFSNIETVCPEVNLKDSENFPFNNDILQKYNIKEKEDIMFKCEFAWQTIISRSLEVRDKILLRNASESEYKFSFKNTLIRLFVIDIDALINALYDVGEMITKCFIFDFEHALVKLFIYHYKNKRVPDVPDGMCLVRRIIISPSRIIYLPPSEHFTNRVIRDCLEHCSENLLRISIADDDFSKLTFAVQKVFGQCEKKEFMTRVVKTSLLNGIKIGVRKYEFLASSNSQLREHGVWMFAKDHHGNTAQSIRTWMGNFNHIKNVAKYMARMGQCFSTSDEAVQIKINDDEIVKLDDITDDGHTFSDGVGMISKDLAREIRKEYRQTRPFLHVSRRHLYGPSAFQIRFKGCKGMVAEVGSQYLSGRKIGIRPSMEKFSCNTSNKLEVVKISAPRAVFLNRPLITILESLGVKENVFLDLQKKMVFKLTDSLIYEQKACKMLEKSTSLDFPFTDLSDAGIYMTRDPFFRSLLLSVYKTKIANLKCKARIAISHKFGRNMLGIVDETKTLKYGEIFAQYSEKVGNIKSETKVLKGIVIVTTNPCMHPGDVRKLEAVDVPALHHIKDCIVFPATGEKPHPDEMSGSDLDGDEYVLIWDPRLIFPDPNYEAMKYPPNKEEPLGKDIEVEDMVDFLCEYIQADNIGSMANAHLALADSDPKSIFSDVCMTIARKYSQALDFAKSGTTCTLDFEERPKCYPDFMEKGCINNSYKSVKTLGLLYKVIRNLEASVSNIEHKVSIEPDRQLEVYGWRQFENLAKYRCQQYSERVKKLLRKFGLQNEAEVLTGYISKVNEYNSNRYDHENTVTLSRKYLIDTMQRFKRKFICDYRKYANSTKLDEKIVKMMMASAWYMVTYQNTDTVCLSFPWVVAGVLLQFKNRYSHITEQFVSEIPFIDTTDDILEAIYLGLRNRIKASDNCLCVSFMYKTMKEWLIKSSFILTAVSANVFCNYCLQRIVENFRSSKMKCCSFNGDYCICEEYCSPMELMLECLKYYASGVDEKLGSCARTLNANVTCQGFHVTNLQSLALKTYAAVAITHNLQYIGVQISDSPDIQFDSYEEGDPIRIHVTDELEEILKGNVDKVCKILQDLSGVKKVLLGANCVGENGYLLVSSIGTHFQRWGLEELIMKPNIAAIIKDRISA